MSRNQEKDAIEMAAKNQRILEEGFRIFSERGIAGVTMTDVAKAAGIGIASLYRYYTNKQELVLTIATWAWKNYFTEQTEKMDRIDRQNITAAQNMVFFLEAFLDLYRNHKDLLRFNQFFNVFLQSEQISAERRQPYNKVIASLEERFVRIYQKGQEDGTLRNDVSEGEMFSTLVHLMMAAVTRYAVGLVYFNPESDEEKELELQKDLLLHRFCVK